MAYVYSQKKTQRDAAGASFTADLPLYDFGDLLLACILNDFGNTTIAMSGWNLIDTSPAYAQNITDFNRHLWFYKVAGTESAPTITGANAGWGVVIFCVKDADTSTPIAGVSRAPMSASAYTGAYSIAAPTVTTSTDRCLIFHSISQDGQYVPFAPNDALITHETVNMGGIAGNTSCMCVGSTTQESAGATSGFNWRSATSGETGVAWVIAIKNATSGKRDISVSSGPNVLRSYNGVSDQATWVKPYTVLGAATIDSVPMSNTAVTPDANYLTGQPRYGARVSTVEVAGSPGVWAGMFDTLSCDLDGKTIAMMWWANYAPQTKLGDGGVMWVFVDGSGNWSAFKMHTKPDFIPLKVFTEYLSPSVTTRYAGSGTVDWTNIDYVGLLFHRLSDSYLVDPTLHVLVTLDDWAVVGGNVSKPVNSKNLAPIWQGSCYPSLFGLQGVGQSLPFAGLQIGDGTVQTYAKFTGNSMELPGSTQPGWNVDASTQNIVLYGSASDTFDFSSAIIASNTRQSFAIHASASTSATYSFIGCSFIGFDVTWKTGIACTLASFSGCYDIDGKGADFTSCTFSNPQSTNALKITEDGSVLDGCTIDGTGAAYAIELGTAVTAITLTDCTITAGSTDKVHVLKTSGTVTITISGTTSLAAGDVTSAGATVVISAPVEYQSVTLSNYVTGSRIQIYDTTNEVELYNDIPAAAPQTLWTDSVAASTSGARDIRVRVAYVSGVTAKQFIEAAIGTVAALGSGIALSYRVNQTDDDTYNSNAVDGSAVTGITIVEGATDRVQIAIAGGSVSWAQIYAYQCYWLFDVVGITDDGAFIEAPDTANYILTGFKIKNTHASIPLLITGGYGVDSTGSVSALYDTTGTSIFPAPAHVVPYATGSGVTPSDITDIASASATATATAVWGDSKALTVPKFLGLK